MRPFRFVSLLRATILLLLSASALMTASADKLNLAQAPLFLSSSVKPNVMLLLDNSGSLNNIIWNEDFDANTDYPDWSPSNCYSYSTGANNVKCWSANDGNVFLNVIARDSRNNIYYIQPTVHTSSSCSSGYYQGVNGSTTKCIKLPDPVGNGNTRYTGNYLNYIFATYANNTDLTNTASFQKNDYRLSISQSVATSVVNNNPNLLFGVAKFNTPAYDSRGNLVDAGPGGYIAATIGSPKSTVLGQISGLAAEANTPLAETLYEVTRYFRGMSSYYNANVSYTSPIQYACQKNFTIVVTDGFPTYDSQFPTDDPADVADTTHALPNWDGVATTTTQDMYPNFPSGSDGFAPTTAGNSDEGRTLFLDDLAGFGYDIDLSSSFAGKQNLITYTVGLTTNNNMLKDAADSNHGHGAYYTANNYTQLQTALQSAINSINAQIGDFSSVAANSTRLDLGTQVIQASFNSGNWSGDVKAYQVYDGKNACSSGSQTVVGELCSSPVWSASSQLNNISAANRVILTYSPSAHDGIPFQWANLDSTQKVQLLSTTETLTANAGNGQLRLNYLRGDHSNEGQAATPRARGTGSNQFVLGDIINSAPFYVGAPSFSYGDSGYASFKSTYANRTAMIYAGANDGMLHGFRASDGRELLAYVPSSAFGLATSQPLYALTQTPFTHAPIVDGSPTVGDVQISSTWKSVLVGGLGGGGRGLYALDVTDPSTFAQTTTAAASTVLWEFTNTDDGDLGYTFSQPSIVKMRNGKWAAIVGNGYSTASSSTLTGKSCLFIVFMDGPDSSTGSWGTSGSRYVKICTSAGGILTSSGATAPNGLAAPAAVDVDGDGAVDYIYAGDELGNLWRFDVNDTSPSNWKVGYNGTPLFKATDVSGNVQPITERPEVGYNLLAANATSGTNPQLAIYFGTGRYLDTGDVTTTGTQTFYAVFDKFGTATANATSVCRADISSCTATNKLIKQQITSEINASGGTCTGDAITASGSCFRVTTSNAVTSANYGWFMDLYNTAGSNTSTYGERQVTTPVLRGGRIIFTTLIPSTDPCNPGGGGWLMELNAKTGSAFQAPVFNTNGDRAVDDNDYITLANGTKVAVSGVRSNVGIPTTPGIINIPGNLEVKYRAGSGRNGATLETLVESSSGRVGRITWREVQK